MKKANVIMFGILAVTIALSALIAPVSAQKYVHPRGILMTTFPQEILVFGSATGEYTVNLAVIIKPPWYFVDGLVGFDSVTLTAKLVWNVRDCPLCRSVGNPPTLAGARSDGAVVATWSNLAISEADNGAFLLMPLTFVMNGRTGPGFYMLYLSAEAEASNAIFEGWDNIPVSVSPLLV
jgi:hypothetical protein